MAVAARLPEAPRRARRGGKELHEGARRASDGLSINPVGFFNHVFCILPSFINTPAILPTSLCILLWFIFIAVLNFAECAMGFCILHSASSDCPETQLLDSGFWILRISGSLSGGESSWEMEVGKLSFWILLVRSAADRAILDSVFCETELEFKI